MTDFGESVAVELLLDRHDEDCYFCKYKKAPEQKENDPDQKFDEDAEEAIGLVADPEGIKHKNDSGKLGDRCADEKPDPRWVYEDGWSLALKVTCAAHHLIPGNAALQKSSLFKDADNGLKIKGKDPGNIGYDVNNRVNGVWLPGSYAFSQGQNAIWGKEGTKFEKEFQVTPSQYAAASIELSGTQYHDSHETYSTKVLDQLEQIHQKKVHVLPWCPEASKPDEKHPPYAIVNRLASLSLKLRRMLTFPTTGWKKEMYTSKYSLEWMERQKGNRTEPTKRS